MAQAYLSLEMQIESHLRPLILYINSYKAVMLRVDTRNWFELQVLDF